MRFLFLFLLSTTVMANHCPQWSAVDAEARLFALAQEIDHHDNLYFHHNTTEVSDIEYDQLQRHLNDLQSCFPSLSPATSVPSISINLSQPHQARMRSLHKAGNEQAVQAFLKKAESRVMLLQPKVDGIAIELVYEKGLLIAASTRGNGNRGRNILPHIKGVTSIPKKLTHTAKVILHGELFARLDKLKDKPHGYASARHFVAAHLNRSEPHADAMAQLDFFPWQWVNSPYQTDMQTMAVLAKEGYSWAARYTYKTSSLEDIQLLRHSFHQPLHPLPFLLDGIVIKLDSLRERQQWGATPKAPNWALAWKFPAETAITQVTDISFNIGRTGSITPIITVNPVLISKMTISSISMGSVPALKQKRVSIGDHIVIQLVGRATPAFKRVLIQHPKNHLPPWMPDPKSYNRFSCLRWSTLCHQQFFARLQWLVGKNGLDLPYLNTLHLLQLVSTGKVKTLSQLLTLSDEGFIYAGLGSEQIIRLQEAIAQTSALPFAQRALAISLPGIGNTKASLLAKHYPDFQSVGKASVEELADKMNSSHHFAHQLHLFLKLPEVDSLISLLSQ